jgi:hypothetical protein
MTQGQTTIQYGQNPHYIGPEIIITNADQGILLALFDPKFPYCASTYNEPDYPFGTITSGCVPGVFNYEMITTSGSSVTSRVTLPSTIDYINPILQAQDGAFYGVVEYTGSEFGNLAKFDTSGNVLWSKPNYYALMATSDGGVIAQTEYPYTSSGVPFYSGPAITFDANGNQTGQISNLPEFSWKGAYQLGSVGAVSSPLTNLASSFAGVPNGNLAGVSPTYVVHTTVGLFWCGTFSGSCAGQQDEKNNRLTDLGFYYGKGGLVPCNQEYINAPPCSGIIDFTASRQDWDGVIIKKAQDAVRAAFAHFPAIVVELATTTYTAPSWVSSVFGGQSKKTIEQNHVAYIHGGLVASGTAGLTNDGVSPSWIYYGTILNGAEITLNLNSQLPAAPPAGMTLQQWMQGWTPQQAAAFQQLLVAAGTDIGNTIAHEVGHQFSLPLMDCDLPADYNGGQNAAGPPCPGPVPHNTFYEYYGQQGPSFLDIGPPLQWTPDDITNLSQQFLKK